MGRLMKEEPLYQELFSEVSVGGVERGSPPATSRSQSTISEVAAGVAERGSPPVTSRLVHEDLVEDRAHGRKRDLD